MEDDEESQNYQELMVLLNEGSHLIRQIFKTQYKQLTCCQWVDGSEQGEQFVTSIGKKCFDSLIEGQFQKNLLRAGNVNEWDIPLLAHVLSTLSTSKNVKSNLKTILYLEQIQIILFHKRHMKSLPNSEFVDLLKKAESAMSSLIGDSFDDFDAGREKIQKKCIDPPTLPSSSKECVNKIENNKNSNATTKELNDMDEKFMESKDPKVRGRACVYFAHRQLTGINVPKNYKEAARLFAQGAKDGNAEGMYNLGLMYQKGQGVKGNLGRAIELFEQAAALPPFNEELQMYDAGVTSAEFALGQCYENGMGVLIDYPEAAKCYKRASDHKNGNAASSLGFMHRDGRGVKQNMVLAKQCWLMAAERGVSLAMDTLAWIYLDRGSISLAEYWFNRSLNAGEKNSIYNQKKFQDKVAQKKLETESVSPPQDDTTNIYQKLQNLNLLSPNEVTPRAKDEGGSKNSWTKLTNSKRVEIVLKHRESIQNCLKFGTNGSSFESTETHRLLYQDGPTKLIGLKDINLDQMDPTKNHLYEGFVLSLIIIEDPIVSCFPYIQTIVRDEEWNVQTCYFYNVEVKDQPKFRFGMRLRVMNPYFRVTYYGVTGIRVDDPESINFQSDVQERDSICRFCGEVNAREYCSACEGVLYCDRKCQEQDWGLLQHELVCHPELYKFL